MLTACLVVACLAEDPPQRPLMRDMLGLNVHTVRFDPAKYRDAFAVLRNYHPIAWDLADDSSAAPPWPLAKNRVNWDDHVYGKWRPHGYDVLATLMLHRVTWRDLDRDAAAYARGFATWFGPRGKRPLVSTVSIGNEPGYLDDATYRRIFVAMAGAVRDADPDLRIATCALTTGPSDTYAKSVELFRGDDIAPLFDVLTIHCYAMVEGWPTWRRSYPEDPGIDYLDRIRKLMAWRDTHATGKPIWVNEFGWDATTRTPDPATEFARWQPVTDMQQAQWLVRSALRFAELGVARCHVYFFDDEDEPKLHAASGIMRQGKPKPAYWALRQLQQTLGAYRFEKVVLDEPGRVMVYAFVSGEGEPGLPGRVWVVWSPTGEGRSEAVDLPAPPGRLARAYEMAHDEAEAAAADVTVTSTHVRVTATESPTYLIWQ